MFKPSLCTLLLSCLPLVTLSQAQYGGGGGGGGGGNGGGGGGSSDTTTTSAESATTTTSASSGIQTVDVGEDGFVFTPDSVNVPPGGKVEFHFYPGNHSVVEAAFSKPCQPAGNTAFFSGFMPAASGESSTIWTLTVNDTSPIWFYCGQLGHCNAGMVGVINPPTSGPDTLAAFKKAAANAPHDIPPATVPSQVQGGILSTEKSESNATSGGETSASGGGKPSPTSSPNDGQKLQFSTDLSVLSFFTFIGAMFMM